MPGWPRRLRIILRRLMLHLRPDLALCDNRVMGKQNGRAGVSERVGLLRQWQLGE